MTDVLRVCPICGEWQHVSAFKAGRRCCGRCMAVWLSRRDHGIRNGLYSATELAQITEETEPTRPWLEGEVFESKMSPNPTNRELNAAFTAAPPQEPGSSAG